jgi:hypothetical protein
LGRTLLAAALAASLSAVAVAQQQVLSSRTLLAVVSAGNRALVELGIDDFVVQEGDTERAVVDVHLADYPLVILLDLSGPSPDHEAILAAAARFVGRIGERPVAIGILTDRTLVTGFDDDRAETMAVLRKLGPRATDRMMPFEALTAAVAHVEKAEAPFSAIVIVSAGTIDPATAAAQEPMQRIVDSRIPVHVVALRAAGGSADSGADLLKEISNLTRGQYTTIYAPASYGIALDRLADRLATEMMIQFLVTPDAPRGEVRVGVRIPGARVTGLGVSR